MKDSVIDYKALMTKAKRHAIETSGLIFPPTEHYYAQREDFIKRETNRLFKHYISLFTYENK